MKTFPSRFWWLVIACVMLCYRTVVVAQWIQSWWTNYCGDGFLRVDLWEECDDGNYDDDDGCSRNCEDETRVQEPVKESQYDFTRVSETTTYKVFMNGSFSHTLEIPFGEEVCDYGVDNGVICEPGYGGTCYYCSDACQLVEVSWSVCGDGRVNHLSESCDDGNLISGDGCSSTCQKENRHVLEVQQPVIQQNNIPDSTQPTHSLMPATTIDVQPMQVVQQVEVIVQPASRPALTLTPVDIWPTQVTKPLVQVVEVPDSDDSPEDRSLNLPANATHQPVAYVPQEAQIRQNMIMRTSPVVVWIWVTVPYPENLSQTWASVPLISSIELFMWLLSFCLCIYATSLFVKKSVKSL